MARARSIFSVSNENVKYLATYINVPPRYSNTRILRAALELEFFDDIASTTQQQNLIVVYGISSNAALAHKLKRSERS